MMPKKIPDVEDTHKPSDPVTAGLDIETQVGRNSCKTLISQTNPVCLRHSKSGLGVKFMEVYTVRNKNSLDIQENRITLDN